MEGVSNANKMQNLLLIFDSNLYYPRTCETPCIVSLTNSAMAVTWCSATASSPPLTIWFKYFHHHAQFKRFTISFFDSEHLNTFCMLNKVIFLWYQIDDIIQVCSCMDLTFYSTFSIKRWNTVEAFCNTNGITEN